MHDDAAYADCIRGLRHAQRAVTKERTAEAPALLRAIDCKPAEHRNRNGIWHIEAKASDAAGDDNRARGQRVIAHDLAVIGDDEAPATRTRAAALCRNQGPKIYSVS